jgi:hypothetical protein
MAKPDITPVGRRFGRLTATGFLGTRGRESWFSCVCDCGNITESRASRLKDGTKQSCGCLMREMSIVSLSKGRFKHGICVGGFPRWYHIYLGMIARCTQHTVRNFDRYGGRGIYVCQQWMDNPKKFLSDMGEPLSGQSIDRIDNDGPYSPENCRWTTDLVQMNNRSCNRLITHEDKTMTVSEWSRHIGIRSATLTKRLNSGWSVDKALTAPLIQNKSHRTKLVLGCV